MLKGLKQLQSDNTFKTVLLAVIAIVVSSTVCMCGIPWVAILAGFAVANAVCWFIGYQKGVSLKYKLMDQLIMLVCSQFGWCACLI